MSRRGIALLLAVALIALLGMIAMTAFTLARTERVAGLAALADVQALAAADAAAAEALRGWPRAQTPVLPGEELPLARLNFPGPAAVIRPSDGLLSHAGKDTCLISPQAE